MWGYTWRGAAYTVLVHVCEAIHEGMLHAQYWYVRLYMKGYCIHSIGMWGYTWKGYCIHSIGMWVYTWRGTACTVYIEGVVHAQYWYVRLYMKGCCMHIIGMWGYRLLRSAARTLLVCKAIHQGVLHVHYWYVRLYIKGYCIHIIGMWGYTWRGAAYTVMIARKYPKNFRARRARTSFIEFYRGEIQPLEKPSPSHATPRTQPVRNRTIHILYM